VKNLSKKEYDRSYDMKYHEEKDNFKYPKKSGPYKRNDKYKNYKDQ
jgi:hypothetical protein